MSAATQFPSGFAPLVARARRAATQAYTPHSRFRVGAAVRTARGAIFVGCNVENASYGLTMCAERNAIAAAVAAEGASMRLTRVAIFVDAADPFPPCGACRQVIAEFAPPETVVVYLGTRSVPVVTTVGDLLPQAFHL